MNFSWNSTKAIRLFAFDFYEATIDSNQLSPQRN